MYLYMYTCMHVYVCIYIYIYTCPLHIHHNHPSQSAGPVPGGPKCALGPGLGDPEGSRGKELHGALGPKTMGKPWEMMEDHREIMENHGNYGKISVINEGFWHF